MSDYNETVTSAISLVHGTLRMTDYVKSISTGVNFDHATGRYVADLDFVGDHDLDFVTGRVLVTIRRPGTSVKDPLARSLVQTLDRVQSAMGTHAMVQLRDIDQSNGKLRVGDRKIRLATADLEWTPALGDRLTMGDGKVYEVVGPDVAVFAKYYLLWCRA